MTRLFKRHRTSGGRVVGASPEFWRPRALLGGVDGEFPLRYRRRRTAPRTIRAVR